MKPKKNIVVLPGDGIGPEISVQAMRVLKKIEPQLSRTIETETALVGGSSIDVYGVPLTDETLKKCQNSDAVLLTAVGGEKWDNLPSHLRPEQALLGLRSGLSAYANLRPVVLFDALLNASSLKKEIIQGVDILVVRELIGGIYFSKPKGIERISDSEERGFNTLSYTTREIKRISKVAFDAAMKRRKKVTSVDKANILESSQLWRKVVIEVAKDYPDVKLEHIYVDNAAMQLIRCPRQFDVIVTGNLFGDILSDAAAQLTGSIGMLASASIGDGTPLFEPVHGSAPDIAGQNKANPIAMILSLAMCLRYAFKENQAASKIENAIKAVLDKGYRTADISNKNDRVLTTIEMTDAILEEL